MPRRLRPRHNLCPATKFGGKSSRKPRGSYALQADVAASALAVLRPRCPHQPAAICHACQHGCEQQPSWALQQQQQQAQLHGSTTVSVQRHGSNCTTGSLYRRAFGMNFKTLI